MFNGLYSGNLLAASYTGLSPKPTPFKPAFSLIFVFGEPKLYVSSIIRLPFSSTKTSALPRKVFKLNAGFEKSLILIDFGDKIPGYFFQLLLM